MVYSPPGLLPGNQRGKCGLNAFDGAMGLVAGLALSALIAWGGYAKRALSRSGMLGAILVGTTIFGFGGWTWGLVLIAFFLSSSWLSRYRWREKEHLAEKFAKTGHRDLGQTLANGGWAAILALFNFFFPSPALFAPFLGAMASVNADTWATELGVLSKSPPRSIANGKIVPVGTSGGITLLGTGAAALAAASIGLVALLLDLLNSLIFQVSPSGPAFLIVLVSLAGGLTGAMFDSLLGARAQGIYHCPRCDKETERRTHSCGQATTQVRGWRRLDNDGVNFLSSMVGSLTAYLLWRWWT